MLEQVTGLIASAQHIFSSHTYPYFRFCVFLSFLRTSPPSSPRGLSVNLLHSLPSRLFFEAVGGWGGGAVWLGVLPARGAVTLLWVFADFIIFIIGRLPPWQSH